MGEVYLARDTRLGRPVALKILARHLAEDERFRRRFERESQIAASLEHPHVLPVYSTGEDRGLLFIAMRHVDGSDLGRWIRSKALEVRDTLRILEEIGSALDAAHRLGLVHRDVKPANILIADEEGRPGEAFLADFGLARPSSADVSGELWGTVHYVAPEQIEGRRPDGRSDVYALACVLFECLTCRPPFARSDPTAELAAHRAEPPPSARSLVPELPHEIDAVFHRGLAKDPAHRYQACSALVTSAREILAATPTPADVIDPTLPLRPASRTVPLVPPSPAGTRRRLRRVGRLVAVALLVGALVATLTELLASPAEVGGDGATDGPPRASPEPTPTPSASPTHQAEADSFPSASELAITARMPADVTGCERSDLGPPALARVTCLSGDQRVQYNLLPDGAAAEAELESRAADLGATEGDCATASFAVGPYSVDGLSVGSVLCYVVDGRAWIEWTWTDPADPSLALYAWATRGDDADATLFEWWRWHAPLTA